VRTRLPSPPPPATAVPVAALVAALVVAPFAASVSSSVAAPVPAPAGSPPAHDVVGIWTADGACHAAVGAGPVALVETRLAIKGCSQPGGIGGYEFRLELPEGVRIVAWKPHGEAVSIGEGGDVVVGLARPLPRAPVVVLAEVTFLVRTASPAIVRLLPRAGAGIPGRMAYVQGDDPAVFHPLTGPCGADSCAAFGFNTGPLPWERADAGAGPAGPVRVRPRPRS
jgi:hypothetical protein